MHELFSAGRPDDMANQGDDFEQFQKLMQARVEKILQQVPDELVNNYWFVRCSKSPLAFYTEFPEASDRQRMLCRTRTILDASNEASQELREILSTTDIDRLFMQ